MQDKEAAFYTTLLNSCGYSFSFLTNLILCISLLALLALLWVVMYARERYLSRKPALVVDKSAEVELRQ